VLRHLKKAKNAISLHIKDLHVTNFINSKEMQLEQF